jgi:hypothetical protein
MNAPSRAEGSFVLLSCAETKECESRLAKLADIVGLRAVIIEADLVVTPDALTELNQCSCLVASRAALSHLRRTCSNLGGNFEGLFKRFRRSLIYGFELGGSGETLLADLTGGMLGQAVKAPQGDREIIFSARLPLECVQLRETSFTAANCYTFQLEADAKDVEPMITVDGMPLLARTGGPERELFLMSGSSIPDVDSAVPRTGPTGESYPGLQGESYLQLVPWLVFFRAAFGPRCWHNPNPHASLIIDDPLLRPQYGFLRYADLVDAMDAHEFTSTIAFIPWNRRRNTPDTVALFAKRRDRLSLCVHGSDHTGGEFRQNDEAELRLKAAQARERMQELRERTGLEYDPVMVFPQGGFCKAALRALDAEGFLAALNTGIFADDSQPDDIRFRDIFDLAIESYGGVPLFSRRYPTHVFPLAFDLFLGKPALIVEHHGFFKKGPERMATFCRKLNRQQHDLVWGSAGRIITEAALFRRNAPEEYDVRFYTDSFSLRNVNEYRTSYRLHRVWSREERPNYLLRDGEPIDVSFRDSFLRAEVTLDPGERVRLEVPRVSQAPVPGHRFSPAYAAKVACRRLLSEFRDNYIARSDRLLSASEMLKRALLQGGRVSSSSARGKLQE